MFACAAYPFSIAFTTTATNVDFVGDTAEKKVVTVAEVVQLPAAILFLAVGFEDFLATRYTVLERATSFVIALLFVPPTVFGLARVASVALGAVLLAVHLRRDAVENAIDVRAQLTRSD